MWTIPPFDDAAAARARQRQRELTKPPGSLGALESVAIQLAGWQGTDLPASRPAAAILFAADHPVARRGVSAYPQEVTAAMVANFAAGGAAASVLCRHAHVPLRVVDVGVAAPYAVPASAAVPVRRDAVADAPAGDICVEDAMSEDVYRAALAAGAAEIDELAADTRLVILGEMGIGNTTPASAVAAALLGCDAQEIVGAGTGVTGAALAAKIAAVDAAVRRVRGAPPDEVVRAVGGRDLAALIGAAARALERRIAVLVDGFIVTAAMLALVRMDPAARQGLLFAHRSGERGHARLLAALDAQPLVDLSMRLGEGSGALVALHLVDCACALHRDMATFASANVPGPAAERP
ncbi:MAG: nicotinate-nucleotide--dimethylbenzimidazole phosphoribosyltransferase [Deltaproteobacteria bacterium]|nr:MAG: nicotinate-nucleotide--dimethylbenzimidazole phosphoribosyltransferase [Deltaproteobacteria bacterium]